MTSAPLYQLGRFQFDLPNGVPQTLDWSADYRWEEQGRLTRDPAQQFLGPGSQTLTLDGVLYPGFTGRQNTLEQLRTLAREGKPLMLTDGLGKVYGRWVIKSLREGKAVFAPGGGARQIGFNISLGFYGEDKPGLAASPLSVQSATQAAGAVAGGAVFSGAGSAFSALGWSQAAQWQGLTQAATGAGFGLGQLAGIATTGASILGQVSSGQYVSAALNAFGLAGFNPTQAGGWGQLGINAANLAQSFVDGRGNAGMAAALDSVARLGGQALVDAGVVGSGDAAAIGTLFKAASTVTPILDVDPRITNAVRSLVVQP
jgi:phage protein U